MVKGGDRRELQSLCATLQSEADRLRGNIQRKDDEIAKEKRNAAENAEASQTDTEIRKSLESQLEMSAKEHAKKMKDLEEEFRRQASALSSPRNRKVRFEGADSPMNDSGASPGGYAIVPAPDALEAEVDKGASWRELHDREEQRACLAKANLSKAQAEMAELKATTSEELQQASEARQELLERQQAVDRENMERSAELKETVRQSEALQQTQESLERENKALQRQLSQAMYDVGKKDREQQLKEAELHEVRQSIHSIQEEMDEVNRELQAQCDRVQRVESSLRLSRDLGSKVSTMREMLRESHSALGQLCGLVDQERAQRNESTQGLRQQQMRTELLLQLLSHFKSRTQDLAPQVLLSQAAELAQGQAGTASWVPSEASPLVTASFPPEFAVASGPSAVPPPAALSAAGYYL